MASAGCRMIDVSGACEELVDLLIDAGIDACLDLRDLNPPGVYVTPPDLAYRFGKGAADATWRIVAAVGNSGRADSFPPLAELLAAAVSALPYPVTAARAVDLTPLDGGGPFPA